MPLTSPPEDKRTLLPDAKHRPRALWFAMLATIAGVVLLLVAAVMFTPAWHGTPFAGTAVIAAVAALIAWLLQREHAARRAVQRVQTDLATSQQLLRAVVDESDDLIIVKDEAGRFILGNTAVADFFGTSTDGLAGKTDAQMGVDETQITRYRESNAKVLQRGEIQRIAEQAISPVSGQTHDFVSVKKPVISAGGASRLLIVARDVTDQRAARARIAIAGRAEKHRSGAVGLEYRDQPPRLRCTLVRDVRPFA